MRDGTRGTGYDVILGIEEAVRLGSFVPPLISVHSANAAAKIRMLAGIRAIERAWQDLSHAAPPFFAVSAIDPDQQTGT